MEYVAHTLLHILFHTQYKAVYEYFCCSETEDLGDLDPERRKRKQQGSAGFRLFKCMLLLNTD